ncbi:MAG: hypothetical protein JKX82_04935 [Oleispira sp.]|nr:hypothetical protein [Oleispira sp.]
MKTGAKYFLPKRDGVTPQLFLKTKEVAYNDGSVVTVLFYKTFCGGWQVSSHNGAGCEEYVSNSLIEIK